MKITLYHKTKSEVGPKHTQTHALIFSLLISRFYISLFIFLSILILAHVYPAYWIIQFLHITHSFSLSLPLDKMRALPMES